MCVFTCGKVDIKFCFASAVMMIMTNSTSVTTTTTTTTTSYLHFVSVKWRGKCTPNPHK